eukprot:Blabericola_migrator_1__12937@NODE_853_length_6253_cov_534_155512_g604_i0_p4_GENE_NODE_853_length_6253_cov_534_155512_g604_i0NODE_853_length_6253_cov_534_155512_g604_i0_p4_ORF_typecomplete_len262_score25_80_NODE_853_length_6253_cov_534_155512_g604_i035424327
MEEQRGLKRALSTFVKSAAAERRKYIVKTRYHSDHATLSHAILDYLRVLLSLTGAAFLIRVAATTDSDTVMTRQDGTRAVYDGLAFAAMAAASTYEWLRFIHYKQKMMSFSGVLEVLAFGALCVSTTIQDASKSWNRILMIVEVSAAVVILAHHVAFAITYRTFAGLYAPIIPSTHSPTVIPTVALATIGAMGLVVSTSFGLMAQLSGEVMYVEAYRIALLVVAILWEIDAWGEVGIVYVASCNAERRAAKAVWTDENLIV